MIIDTVLSFFADVVRTLLGIPDKKQIKSRQQYRHKVVKVNRSRVNNNRVNGRVSRTNSRTNSNNSSKTTQDNKQRRVNPGWSKKREEVWTSYFGDRETGICYCCKTRIYKKSSPGKKAWHCSHVKAYRKGVSDSISNLRCCCPTCNLSMGTENMYVWMKKKGYM